MTWFSEKRHRLRGQNFRRVLLTAWAGWALVLLVGLAAPAAGSVDKVVMIVNHNNANPVDNAFIAKVYTGGIRSWPDGSAVIAFDQARDPTMFEAFCLGVLQKRPATVRAIWSQNIFTGRASLPRTVASDTEMKRLVAAERHAIGYIRSSQLDESVRKVGDD